MVLFLVDFLLLGTDMSASGLESSWVKLRSSTDKRPFLDDFVTDGERD